MQWAHFPHIHFGKQQAKLDHGEGTREKTNGFHWYKYGSLCFFYVWPKSVKINEVFLILQQRLETGLQI